MRSLRNTFLIILALACAAIFPGLAMAQDSVLPADPVYGHLDSGLTVVSIVSNRVRNAVNLDLVFRMGPSYSTKESSGYSFVLQKALTQQCRDLAYSLAQARDSKVQQNRAFEALGIFSWGVRINSDTLNILIEADPTKISNALDLLQALVADPTAITEDQLALARSAALSTIVAQKTDNQSVYQNAISRTLFARYPWRVDVLGSPKVDEAITLTSLHDYMATWCIPGNAALVVDSGLEPSKVMDMVTAAFASWHPQSSAVPAALPKHPTPGVLRPTWMVFPDQTLPEGAGQIELYYRGPDLKYDPKASITARVWEALVAAPGGRFKSSLRSDIHELAGPDGISAFFAPFYDSSWIYISSFFELSEKSNPVVIAQNFKERVRGTELTSMKLEPAYFSPAEYEKAKKDVFGDYVRPNINEDFLINSMALLWATGGEGYFASLKTSVQSCTNKDLSAFVDRYFMKNLEIIAVRISKEDFERNRSSFAKAGFIVIDSSKAFWWNE